MNLKDKIEKLLTQQKHTYKELAEHLNLSEKQLDHALETKTLEVRTLELISKELRIPLYSFFRDPEMIAAYANTKESYYNVNIWSDQEIKYKNEIILLREEISKLNLEISKRDLLIEALESQLKKS
jgi:transcriptional regulator with XRE-family HTH domain